MKITTTHDGWDIEVLGSTLNITVIKDIYNRGGQMGEITRYGSAIKYEGPCGSKTTQLSIVDREYPNCSPSLKKIILEHSRQYKLGTFGEVDSPYGFSNKMFIDVLFSLGEDYNHDSVSEYIQIPFVTIDEDSFHQAWEATHVSQNVVYKAHRRYVGSYYVTKVERELDCYEHPLRDGVPDNNIIRRKEVVETTSLKATPLQLIDVIKVFG